MSYRKLVVNESNFEYSIGKTHTKIRHVGVWPNEEIGQWYSIKDNNGDMIRIFQIRPSDISHFISAKINNQN